MSEYIKEVKLPTGGRIYDSELGIPDIVKIRSMTTNEEKIVFGSTDNAIEEVIQQCIVEPKGLKISDLIVADSMTILIDLRMLTYGTNYKIPFECTDCRRRNPEVIADLSTLEFHELRDDFDEPMEIELPRSGDTLGVVLLRNKDFREISKAEKKVRKKFPGIKGDIGYILRMAKHIKTINGEEVDFERTRQYVEKMMGYDSAYFWNEMNKIEIGYDLTHIGTCIYCGAEVEFYLPVTAEFFRPSFE